MRAEAALSVLTGSESWVSLESVRASPARQVAPESRRISLVASLLVIQGADQGKRFEFTSGPVALGRDNSNAVQLHDNEVSRRHAELRSALNGYEIVDLGSANGTYVNDRAIDRAAIR